MTQLRMKFIVLILAACGVVGWAQSGGSETPSTPPLPSTISVSGHGEVAAKPDRAVVSLGAMAQADQAAEAQVMVNQIMQQTLDRIKTMGIPAEHITTTGLSLSPVYSDYSSKNDGKPPRIVGYRAHNTVRVQLDNIEQVGSVLDTGVAAGANQIEGISFELKNDLPQRQAALRDAVQEARAKAEAIAGAIGVRLGAVYEVIEGGVELVRPQVGYERGMVASAKMTPVEPGQVKVNASVTVRYLIVPEGGRR
jgi:uncharacterized protein YggE